VKNWRFPAFPNFILFPSETLTAPALRDTPALQARAGRPGAKSDLRLAAQGAARFRRDREPCSRRCPHRAWGLTVGLQPEDWCRAGVGEKHPDKPTIPLIAPVSPPRAKPDRRSPILVTSGRTGEASQFPNNPCSDTQIKDPSPLP
jgi:hypothetical protein